MESCDLFFVLGVDFSPYDVLKVAFVVGETSRNFSSHFDCVISVFERIFNVKLSLNELVCCSVFFYYFIVLLCLIFIFLINQVEEISSDFNDFIPILIEWHRKNGNLSDLRKDSVFLERICSAQLHEKQEFMLLLQ